MKLKHLLQTLEITEQHGTVDREIKALSLHSGQTGPDALFVAIRGTRSDGHAYLEDAYRNGTRVFITEESFIKPDAVNVVVPDTRQALAALAAEFYRHPSRELRLIGITGTNGKTTTAFILESILRRAGLQVGLISTIAYRFSTRYRPADRTTPDALGLQQTLREMADNGINCVVMEVSSHGLDQHRVAGCHFDAAVYTNLTPEHLDYHKTMENYFQSKKRLFTDVLPSSKKKKTAAVVNMDDERGSELSRQTPCRTLEFGFDRGDIHARDIDMSLDGITATLVTPAGDIHIQSPLIGTFNLYNIMGAVAAALFLEIPVPAIREGIAATRSVPGRMERIDNTKNKIIFVDYAHTGDAVKNVLQTLKAAGAENIIIIFGCGGDRDREKRPVMGGIAASYCGTVILTTDNPRSEDPMQIIHEIEVGVLAQGFTKAASVADMRNRQNMYCVCSDRKAAIQAGIQMAQADDVVLIAGKGHETYQETGTEKHHFDDREEARQALQLCA